MTHTIQKPLAFVTNDDGIDSVGLHVLARSLIDLGEVTIAAPDQEYSGAGAAIGALHISRPEVHQVNIDKIEKSWSVSGPPALCVMYATRGVLEDSFDLVVSGINPGSNVGNSIYHSGTIGAAFTARNAGITFLGEIPLNIAYRESADNGHPIVAQNPQSQESQYFISIAKKLSSTINL